MIDVPKEIGKVIEARKAYPKTSPLHHIYNNIVSLLREWMGTKDNEHRARIARGLKYQRDLAEKQGAKFH